MLVLVAFSVMLMSSGSLSVQVTTYFDFGSKLLSHPLSHALTFISLTPRSHTHPDADVRHVVGTPYLQRTHWSQYTATLDRHAEDAVAEAHKTIFSVASFGVRAAGHPDRTVAYRFATCFLEHQS